MTNLHEKQLAYLSAVKKKLARNGKDEASIYAVAKAIGTDSATFYMFLKNPSRTLDAETIAKMEVASGLAFNGAAIDDTALGEAIKLLNDRLDKEGVKQVSPEDMGKLLSMAYQMVVERKQEGKSTDDAVPAPAVTHMLKALGYAS